MNGTKDIRHDGIILRKYTMNDVPMIHRELGCDPDMLEFTGWNPYASLESTEDMVRGFIDSYEHFSGSYSWIINDGTRDGGTIGAYDYDAENSTIEIGYSIFKSCWGRGFATKSVAAATNYLMEEEGIGKVTAWTAADNTASIRALEKNGFAVVGTEVNGLDIDGVKHDRIVFEKAAHT